MIKTNTILLVCLWSLKSGDGSQYKHITVGLYICVRPFHALRDQSLVIKGDFLNDEVASTSVPHHMCVTIMSVIKKLMRVGVTRGQCGS